MIKNVYLKVTALKFRKKINRFRKKTIAANRVKRI